MGGPACTDWITGSLADKDDIGTSSSKAQVMATPGGTWGTPAYTEYHNAFTASGMAVANCSLAGTGTAYRLDNSNNGNILTWDTRNVS